MLYAGSRRQFGFMDAIRIPFEMGHKGWGVVSEMVTEVSKPYNSLDGVSFVVLVGRPERVFYHEDVYYGFLIEAEKRGIPVAGIIDEGDSFPDSNLGIQGGIVKTSRNLTISDIVKKLSTEVEPLFDKAGNKKPCY